MGLNAITQYVPYTEARQRRLTRTAFQKIGQRGDVLVEYQYADGKVSYKAAEWDADLRRWITEDDETIKPAGEGLGSREVQAYGVNMIRAHEQSAGPVSTEASLAARAIDNDEFVQVDANGDPLATDDNGDPITGDVAAQTGQQYAEERPHFDGVQELEYDAIGFALEDAIHYDPNPVSRQEVENTIDQATIAQQDPEDKLRSAGLGFAAGAGVIILFILIMSIASSMTGGSGGGGGSMLPMMIGMLGVVKP